MPPGISYFLQQKFSIFFSFPRLFGQQWTFNGYQFIKGVAVSWLIYCFFTSVFDLKVNLYVKEYSVWVSMQDCGTGFTEYAENYYS